MNCRACHARIEPFMSFGKMPLANGFLTADEVPNESFYELEPAVCPRCGLFQIMEQPMPDRMFHAQYPYYTSNSQHMQTHFEKFAKSIGPGFVVELGCNDGTMLRHFIGRKHLGLEPAANVAQVAGERGCTVWNNFFDSKLAAVVVSEFGKADYVLAANVICHVADLPDLCDGVCKLLSGDGRFIFEEPYLLAMLGRCSFDQIYDEHVFMFSCTSVQNAFGRHGLHLYDCEPQEAHGGSMRYFLSKSRKEPSPLLLKHLDYEKNSYALQEPKTYEKLRTKIEEKRHDLKEVIRNLRHDGKRIVGYGATSKSTTVTVYCGLTTDDIEYISDTTPIKQGKLSPGAHIPVKPYEEFQNNPPDVALLFAWNHSKEIFSREKFQGQWLRYVPRVSML